jgi:hypothetical protein
MPTDQSIVDARLRSSAAAVRADLSRTYPPRLAAASSSRGARWGAALLVAASAALAIAFAYQRDPARDREAPGVAPSPSVSSVVVASSVVETVASVATQPVEPESIPATSSAVSPAAATQVAAVLAAWPIRMPRTPLVITSSGRVVEIWVDNDGICTAQQGTSVSSSCNASDSVTMPLTLDNAGPLNVVGGYLPDGWAVTIDDGTTNVDVYKGVRSAGWAPYVAELPDWYTAYSVQIFNDVGDLVERRTVGGGSRLIGAVTLSTGVEIKVALIDGGICGDFGGGPGCDTANLDAEVVFSSSGGGEGRPVLYGAVRSQYQLSLLDGTAVQLAVEPSADGWVMFAAEVKGPGTLIVSRDRFETKRYPFVA